MNPVRSTIRFCRRCVSVPLRLIRFYAECLRDGTRYLKASSLFGDMLGHAESHLESDIVRRYHVIEKGLSMEDFRPRFGIEMVGQLHSALKRWQGPFNMQIAAGWRVLEAYQSRHADLGIDVADVFDGPLEIPAEYQDCGQGGVKPYCPVDGEDRDAFLRVMTSRVSVRNFDQSRVPDEKTIETVVEAAISTPSVCNRQTWRVHAYSGDQAKRILALQNGNRGFGHAIPLVLIVTSDMRQFVESIERYQPWIDGGMFSMSLLLALHAEGLGAVPLNWAVLNQQDQKLRKEGEIPDYERVIMLIGCGYPGAQATVPVSTRRPASEIFRFHGK